MEVKDASAAGILGEWMRGQLAAPVGNGAVPRWPRVKRGVFFASRPLVDRSRPRIAPRAGRFACVRIQLQIDDGPVVELISADLSLHELDSSGWPCDRDAGPAGGWLPPLHAVWPCGAFQGVLLEGQPTVGR